MQMFNHESSFNQLDFWLKQLIKKQNILIVKEMVSYEHYSNPASYGMGRLMFSVFYISFFSRLE